MTRKSKQDYFNCKALCKPEDKGSRLFLVHQSIDLALEYRASFTSLDRYNTMDEAALMRKLHALEETQDERTSLPSPLTYASRLSAVDNYKQYVFPTATNNLTYDLESPYAFSYLDGAFFWTREDALSAIQWQPAARPPCLNCVVAGEVSAKLCDRLSRQERHKGMVRCCHRCEKLGHQDSCVELVELRVDWPSLKEVLATPKDMENLPYVPRRQTAQTDRADSRIWTISEKKLRASGKVIWRPINLQYGDVCRKKDVVAQLEAGAGQRITRLRFSPSSNRSWQTPHDTAGNPVPPVSLKVARQQVAQWDAEHVRHSDSDKAAPSSTLATTIARSGSHLSTPTSASSRLSGDFQYWSSCLLAGRSERYKSNLKQYGRTRANREDKAFEDAVVGLLSSLRELLDQRKSLMSSGYDESEAHKIAVQKLSEGTQAWFQDLVPDLIYGNDQSRSASPESDCDSR